MVVRKIFNDSDSNRMDCYVNENYALFIEIGKADQIQTESQKIELHREDVIELIKLLQKIEKDIDY